MNVLHIPGLQSLISFNAIGRSSPKYESSQLHAAGDGPMTSSRPASALDVRLDEQVLDCFRNYLLHAEFI